MLAITSFLILLYRYCEKAELFSLLCNSSIHVASGQRYPILTTRTRDSEWIKHTCLKLGTSKLKLFPSPPCPVAMLFAFVVALTFTGPKFQQICNILNNFMFWEIVILIELISLIIWLWVFTHSPLRSILVCYLLIYPAQQTELRQSSYVGL